MDGPKPLPRSCPKLVDRMNLHHYQRMMADRLRTVRFCAETIATSRAPRRSQRHNSRTGASRADGTVMGRSARSPPCARVLDDEWLEQAGRLHDFDRHGVMTALRGHRNIGRGSVFRQRPSVVEIKRLLAATESHADHDPTRTLPIKSSTSAGVLVGVNGSCKNRPLLASSRSQFKA